MSIFQAINDDDDDDDDDNDDVKIMETNRIYRSGCHHHQRQVLLARPYL